MESISILKDIIARRALHLIGRGEEPEIVVNLGRPFQPNGGWYCCEFQIVSPGRVHEMHADGVDTVDCVISALRIIGTYLADANRSKYGGNLQWEGGTAAGLGFPTVEDWSQPRAQERRWPENNWRAIEEQSKQLSN
ncbi:MAG: DUF6968 family protein [Bryobacteraceae bacterium]